MNIQPPPNQQNDQLSKYLVRNESLGVDEEMVKDAIEHDYKSISLVI